MITSKQFPHQRIKQTVIGSPELFPFFAEAANGSPFCICKDGSLAVFFKMGSEYDAKLVDDILGLLSFGSTFQMYKLKTFENIQYFGCIKIFIDYSSFNFKFFDGIKDALKRIFSGYDSVVDSFNENTQEIVNSICDMLNNRVTFVPIFRENNVLYSGLADCFVENGEFCLSQPLLADMSVVTTGRNRYSVMVSLNSVHGLDGSDLLKDYEYLQIFSVCVPMSADSEKLDNYYTGTFNMFDLLKKPEYNPQNLTFTREEKGFVFTHTSFLLSGDSETSAISLSESFCNTLEDNKILLFRHTNSAATNYAACFPGNAERGYLYQSNYRESAEYLLRGDFAL